MNDGTNSNNDVGFASKLHICMVYSDEAERRAVIANFLAMGAKRGEKLSYFITESSKANVLDLLQSTGVDAQALDHAGRLHCLPTSEAYYPDGVFSKEAMWERVCGWRREAENEGFPAWRATAEMSWALREDVPGREQLIAYESGLNRLPIPPTALICQYDARRFDDATLLEVLRVHPYVIAGGVIVSNPYYEPS